MVISEAMAARVPVVVSNVCGAADHVMAGAGQTLGLSDSEDDWIAAIETELTRQFQPPGFERTWKQVALEYENIYRTLSV
jgi:UDP-glucose:(heptosyl)LPS alpha-1,3-glucosyltransferase